MTPAMPSDDARKATDIRASPGLRVLRALPVTAPRIRQPARHSHRPPGPRQAARSSPQPPRPSPRAASEFPRQDGPHGRARRPPHQYRGCPSVMIITRVIRISPRLAPTGVRRAGEGGCAPSGHSPDERACPRRSPARRSKIPALSFPTVARRKDGLHPDGHVGGVVDRDQNRCFQPQNAASATPILPHGASTGVPGSAWRWANAIDPSVWRNLLIARAPSNSMLSPDLPTPAIGRG